jgi:hypothetical protein
VVAPVRDAKRRELFRRALEAVNKRHHRALKRLAD